MKQDEDFRIQEMLDQKMKGVADVSHQITNKEVLEAYQLVYEQLAKAPVGQLSHSFSANVWRRIEMEKKQTSDQLFYGLLAFVSLVGLLLVISVLFIFKDAFAPVWGTMDKFKGVIAIGIAAIFAFHLIEKKSLGMSK